MTSRLASGARAGVVLTIAAMAAWFVASAAVLADQRPAGRLEGLSLTTALTRLQQSGLPIVFSSELVRPEMIVAREPRGPSPKDVLDELVVPHGLRVKSGPAGTLLIIKAPAGAASGTIAGLVHAAGTRQPIAGVDILAAGTKTRAQSKADGVFSTGPLPQGRYVLEVRRPGYLPQKVEHVPVTAGAVTHLRLELHPRHVHVEEIVVRASQGPPAREAPAIRESLIRELQTSPERASDPLLPVARVTGVTTGAGTSGLHVRGSARREAKIVLDGLELYEPYHLKDRGGPISLIDSHTIAEVGLLSGAFPAEYGGHTGAVLEMDTIVPSSGLGGEIGVSRDDARLTNSGSFGDRVRWMVSGRRGDPALLLNALDADPNYRPTYWDTYGKADIRLDDSSTLSLHVLAGDDEVEAGGEDESIVTLREPGRFKSRHTNGYQWITFGRAFTPTLFAQTVVSHAQLTSTRQGYAPRVQGVHDRRSAEALGVKQDWLRQSGGHLLKFGFDVRRLHATYDYTSVPAHDPATDHTAPATAPVAIGKTPAGTEMALYAADRFHLLPKLHVELGLRWDAQTFAPDRRGSLGPRINALYAMGDRTSVRVGWGLVSQSQKIHELQVEDGVSMFLPAEQAEHRVISVAHQFASGVRAQVNAYQKLVRDVNPRFENLFDPFGFFPEADAYRVRIAPSAARAEGLEIVARRDTTRTVGWRLGYSLARSEDEIGGWWVPRRWDQRHTLNAGFDWTPDSKWTVALAGNIHSGRPTTSISALEDRRADGLPVIVPIIGPRNSERLAPGARLDARVSRTVRLRGSTLTASVTVNDLFDSDDTCCISGYRFSRGADGVVSAQPQTYRDISRFVSVALAWRF